VKLLAIETSTIEVGVAIIDEQGLRASMRSRPGRLHTETLHPAIEAVSRSARTTLGELDAIVIDVGPGLFTGLRVGVATAKALGLALGVPLVACYSTELLRRGAAVGGGPIDDLVVIPVVDMRRGEVAFELPAAPGTPVLGDPQGLANLLLGYGSPIHDSPVHDSPVHDSRGDPTTPPVSSHQGSPFFGALLVGDGARRYRDELGPAIDALRLRIGGDDHLAPSPTVLGELGMERLLHGAVTDAVALQPMYLREADTRINWTTRAIEEALPVVSSAATEKTGDRVVNGSRSR
jgi:tRNA threonylcarbamoyladenosine biosynthesis protein TsaB